VRSDLSAKPTVRRVPKAQRSSSGGNAGDGTLARKEEAFRTMLKPETGQVWNPKRYAQEAGFVSALGLPVVELLAPQPGEKILDLGCGDGTLALKLMEMGCDVVGVDSSSEFVAAAREKGVDAECVDGRKLRFDREFDAVFSNAALHWMTDPEAVVSGVYRALKPSGRFVGEFGGRGNVACIIDALNQTSLEYGVDPEPLNPWYFPSADEYGRLLKEGGFLVRDSTLFPRPTPLSDDLLGWLNTFALSFLAPISADDRPAFLRRVRDRLSRSIQDASGKWTADYVRL
jgi:trans-aconitate methyltransferase